MDSIEATKMVMSRIQNIDPENASKIMGYILIQEHGENEIIRLAFGPENLLASVVKQAKAFLDVSSSPSPFGVIPPLSPHSPWSSSASFQDRLSSPRAASYASVVNGGGSPAAAFYNNFNQVPEEYSSNVDFLDGIVSPSDSILFPYANSGTDCGDAHHHLHRSCSVNDVLLGGGGLDDDAGGWKPCMYFTRGFCKNGTSCKFVHGNGNGNGVFGDDMCSGSSSPTAIVGSPTGGNFNGFEDFLRIKAIQQQHRVAAMAAHPFPYNRCFNFLSETPRSPTAASLMMGEEVHKFGRFRPDRHDFALASMGLGSSSSRQIYLTFPADSTFKEEDVSNYFSIFGPVQDVRIPYQQKRMFGFVTFVLPETVKAILAKGNPHFVCDSRVLVKPYKEKGKISDKKHHQHQIERGDFSALESAEPFDHIPFGARMFNHDLMLRKKLAGRAELQQAIDFQERNLMNMQLTTTDPQLLSPSRTNQSLVYHNNVNVVSGEEIKDVGCQEPLTLPQEVNDDDSENNSSGKESFDLSEHQSFFEHILPDNLFASPTKTAAANHQSTNTLEADAGGASANTKSFYFQMPRSVCGQEAIKM